MAQAAGLRVTDAYVGYDPATTSPRPPDTSGAALSGRGVLFSPRIVTRARPSIWGRRRALHPAMKLHLGLFH